MAGDPATVDRTPAEASRRAWPDTYRRLHDEDPDTLTATDLEALADAAWWLSRVEESLAARRRAHAAYVAAGDARRAGYNAWMLATEYGFIGKPALAAGWLSKARRHLAGEPECVERGFLAFTEAEVAAEAGDLAEMRRIAGHMVELGTRCGSPDVVAMGRLLEGQWLITAGEVAEGLARLDELMCDVMDGVLSDLVTGWLYCLAVPLCLKLSDLERAATWNDASLAWCATLPLGSTPFHGLCRVHHVELLVLSGAWHDAGAEAGQACRELMGYHPHMAAEAFYVTGELRRRRDDLAGAEESFLTAHELGHDPQPGLALLRLDQGRAEAAAAALASCLAGGEHDPLQRARLRAAQTEVGLALADLEIARDAVRDLETMADGSGSSLLEALAATASGATCLADGDVPGALERLRRAVTLWLELGPPYETARARTLLATACGAAGDDDTATLELRTARAAFERLGAVADLRRVDELLGTGPGLPGGLTPRQVEVLRLLAAGRTNRAIAAELVISEHTVSRHVENIYTRLGVSSRAAAAAFAHTHGLV